MIGQATSFKPFLQNIDTPKFHSIISTISGKLGSESVLYHPIIVEHDGHICVL